ncbi:hypothetical protein PIB30_022049 [Stylosanthes scabra]|uniref:Uncharacterized protein n=1 Tax=Stylosanthes scabra TaxID=79078 RepID=A0ABU6Z5U3_9FABA|nr:hypothetical protein [Stylosanthes scabra]
MFKLLIPSPEKMKNSCHQDCVSLKPHVENEDYYKSYLIIQIQQSNLKGWNFPYWVLLSEVISLKANFATESCQDQLFQQTQKAFELFANKAFCRDLHAK